MGVVTAVITSNGQQMSETFELVSVDVQREVNRIPTATLVLNDGSPVRRGFDTSDDPFFDPGRQVVISLRPEEAPQARVPIFKGRVIRQGVLAAPGVSQLTVELRDEAIGLTYGRRSVVYRSKSDSDVFRELVQGHGLKVGTVADTQPMHEALVQYQATDWDFLLSRAEACGLLLLVEDGAVSLVAPTLDGPALARLDLDACLHAELELDATHQRSSITCVAWDVKEQKPTSQVQGKDVSVPQGDLSPSALAKGIGARAETFSSMVPMPPESLQAWADGALRRDRLSLLRGVLCVPGDGNLKCLKHLQITGVGKHFNGRALITGIRHRVDSTRGWETDIQCGLSHDTLTSRQDLAAVPAAGLLPWVHGLQVGVVAPFTDDPEGEHRVKVLLPAVHEKEGEVWARRITPDAGRNRGLSFAPEAGDEVVVGFFNSDPGQAVILGSLFSSKNAPPAPFAHPGEKNLLKGITTRSGITLAFNDDEKPSVYLETPSGIRILLDDGAQTVEIRDKNENVILLGKDGIALRGAKGMKIKTDGDLDLEAGGNIRIKGSQVDVQ